MSRAYDGGVEMSVSEAMPFPPTPVDAVTAEDVVQREHPAPPVRHDVYRVQPCRSADLTELVCEQGRCVCTRARRRRG